MLKPAFLSPHFYGNDRELFLFLRNVLGEQPYNIALYKQALRHKSASLPTLHGMKDSNERLEFLGDSIIGASVASYLYKKYPFRDEGFLTKLRSRIVSRENLSALSRKMGFGRFIEHSLNGTSRTIEGDVFEAVIGALFMDKGYHAASRCMIRRIIAIHIDVDALENIDNDYKSQLLAHVQKEKKTYQFEIIREGGRGRSDFYHLRLFVNGTAVSEGKGSSKKAAEQHASELFIKNL